MGLGRLVRLTSRDGELLLGCEESILSLILPPFVPVIVLGLTRGSLGLGEHLRRSSRDRWSRKVSRVPSSHSLVIPSIASVRLLSGEHRCLVVSVLYERYLPGRLFRYPSNLPKPFNSRSCQSRIDYFIENE